MSEQLKNAVQALIDISTQMNKSIIETQNKILTDYTERLNKVTYLFSF